jgi:hypothetical protein
MMKIHCNVFNLQALLDVFPDAQIVMGHRDCSEVVASTTSYTYKMGHVMFAYKHQKLWALQQNWCQGKCGEEMVRQKLQVLAERKVNGLPVDNLFIDYAYKNIMGDPIGTVQKLYSQLGMTFSPDTRQAMQTWLDNNKQDKYGRHVYSLDQFGLTQDDIQREWAEYQNHFRDYLL